MSSIFFLMLKCKSILKLPVPYIVATCHRTKTIKEIRKHCIFAFYKESRFSVEFVLKSLIFPEKFGGSLGQARDFRFLIW